MFIYWKVFALFMRRKIIKQGINGHTIYLPKSWTDSNNLTAGDFVELENEGNNLLISTKNIKVFEKEKNLEIKSSDYHTYRSIIGGFYRAGVTKIFVKLDKSVSMNVVTKIVNSISGYEVVDLSNDGCIIQSLYVNDSNDIKKYIQTMISVAKTIQSSIIQAMKSGNFDIAEELFHYRDMSLRQRDLIMRTIVQQKLIDDLPHYQIAQSLWNISRFYYILFNNLKKKKYDLQTIGFVERVEEYFEETFRKINEKDIHSRHSQYVSLRNENCNMLDAKKDSVVNSFLVAILSSIYSAESSIISLLA